RRAQLVGHVREKFRLVARGERELLRFSLQRLTRLLDLPVLALDFFVLFDKLSRLFLQLLVGLLQFFLPALQLGGERLRLLEQILRARVRLDSVQDDADAFCELIEKRLVRRIELLERGKFHDRFHLALKQDRQHHNVHRRRFAQSGANLYVVGRHAREQDALFFQRRLADKSFAESEASVHAFALAIGVTRQKLKLRLFR